MHIARPAITVFLVTVCAAGTPASTTRALSAPSCRTHLFLSGASGTPYTAADIAVRVGMKRKRRAGVPLIA
jgi:hypothetical protein